MKPYADTNFFTRLYLNLPESGAARELLALGLQQRFHKLPITWIHRLEIINALHLSVHVSRSIGQTRVTQEQAAVAVATFHEDLNRGSFLRSAEIDALALEQHFGELSMRYTPRYGFRTYDIIHVANAELLGCDLFWSFDTRANKLATLQALKTAGT